MMKIIVYIGTSLDGFIARKDGNIGWLVQFANDEAISAYEELTGRIDAIVMGRGTFEKVLSFPSWPYEKPVFVLSTTIKQVPDSIDGGKVIRDFLKENLIDDLIISKPAYCKAE